jgi:hypothetical protein
LSAEPIAAAMGLVDPNPTLESPPPRSAMRGAHLARSFSTTPPAPLPQFALPSKSVMAPKAAAPIVKRAARTPSPATVRPAERSATVSENTAIIEQTALLDAPRAEEPLPLTQANVTEAPAASPIAETAESPVPLGQLLHGRYELQSLLGRGGMASVYKAIDHDRARLGLTDRLVAVKVVQANSSRPASPAALIQEFQSAQRLSHPNVINVFDIDQDGDTTFYSMELLSGARLSQVLRRVDGTVLQRRLSLAIIRDIGAAVAHAHARGVVHADLKPSNVMITHDGEVRVLDFGGSSMPPREPWVSAGDADDAYHHATPAYASCEQLERRRADPRDDIYAIACIAYLLLAGRHPFDYLSSIEARSRGMQAQRPAGMPLRQWRVLRQGLTWGRANQPTLIEPWLAGLGLNGAVPRLPPLSELTAAAETAMPWIRPAVIGAAAIAVIAGAWAVLSDAPVDWNGKLDSGINGAQDALQKTWHALDSGGHEPASRAPAVQSPVAAAKPPTRAPASRLAQTAAPPPLAAPKGAGVVASTGASAPSGLSVAATAPPAAAADASPHVAFASHGYTVGAADPAARIVIQRAAGAQGDLNFIWWTEGDSAEPDVDYASLGARTERLASGENRVTVYVPIISNPLRRKITQFQVILADATSHRGNGGAQNLRATVTIEGNR